MRMNKVIAPHANTTPMSLRHQNAAAPDFLHSLAQVELPGRSRVGCGVAACHHGEVLQGADRDPVNGRQRVLLVTLRTQWVGSQAVFRPVEGAILEATDGGKSLALRSARLALEALGRETWGGTLDVRSFT